MTRSMIGAAAMAVGTMTAAATAGTGDLELTPIAVGSGINSSYVQIDFDSDLPAGQTYLFEVYWNSAPTGFEMLELLQSDVGLTLDADYFDFDGDGNFTDAIVTELGYGGHAHTATPTDFWTYWMRDSDSDAWATAVIGVSDRLAGHGTWDGWSYGEFGEYTPRAVTVVPTPGGAVLLAALALGRRRRTRR